MLRAICHQVATNLHTLVAYQCRKPKPEHLTVQLEQQTPVAGGQVRHDRGATEYPFRKTKAHI